MTIVLEREGERRELTAQDHGGSLQTLEHMLSPGIPVMLQNYRQSDSPMRGGTRVERFLFISDGSVDAQGVFGLQKGQRNFCYATLDEKDPASYKLVHWGGRELGNHRFSLPHGWTRTHTNEHTFSSAPSSSSTSAHSAGTQRVLLGRDVVEAFPDAMRALRFARDAVYFRLHPFYSMQGHLVSEIGDGGLDGTKRLQMKGQTHRIACLRACMNLLKETHIDLEVYDGDLVAKHVGWKHGRTERLRDKGFPVEEKDYVIRWLSHPKKSVALVKAKGGSLAGETYVLPFGEEMVGLIDMAFSREMVRKYYPYGLDS